MAGARGKVFAIGLVGETEEEAKDRSRFDFGMVCVYLYAVIVELSIKAIWSFENQGQEPMYTHDVAKFFSELQPETQNRIKDIYITTCSPYHNAIFIGMHQHGRESMQVGMATLEEALAWNKMAIRDYKYNLNIDERSVPCGAMWGDGHVYLSAAFPNFSYPLLDFVAERTGATR